MIHTEIHEHVRIGFLFLFPITAAYLLKSTDYKYIICNMYKQIY